MATNSTPSCWRTRWLAIVGDTAYALMMRLNHLTNRVRSRMGLPYWSLSKAAKHKVKNAVEFISRFEELVARAGAPARRRRRRGRPYPHTAEYRLIDGVEYYNDGDWVEGCTALVEHFDGRMEILHWADEIARREANEAALHEPMLEAAE